ncbi:MAG: GH92 family glycosyl hydrolase [Myxococcota bacterium]
MDGGKSKDGRLDDGDAETTEDDESGDSAEKEDDDFDESERLVNYVDPFIGSGGKGYGVGSAFVGATAPFGMVKVGPDTTGISGAAPFSHCSGYYYEDTIIEGFSHIHFHGTGVPDYGNILFIPTIGMDKYKTDERGYRSNFDKATEEASPGYYAVTLADHNIRVELAATERAAYHRYTFNDNGSAKDATVIIDLAHTIGEGKSTAAAIELLPETGEAFGFMHNNGDISSRFGGFDVFFYAIFDRAPKSYGVFIGEEIKDGETKGEDPDLGGYLYFDMSDGESLLVKVGISYISVEQAKANLIAELSGKDFDDVRQETEDYWEEELSVIRLKGGSREQKVMFYTALYHALFMPTLFTDADGRYKGFDGENHLAEGFLYYSDFSMWDTYRTEHPLLTLIKPARERDMATSLIKMYEQGGYIPKWPLATGYTNTMIGTPGDIVISDTFIKGVTDFDVEKAYEGLYKTATAPTPTDAPYSGRGGINSYISRGYVPSDETDTSVSLTLEFAFADFNLSELAKTLGKDEDAAMFAERAENYRNVYDPESGYFWGRLSSGDFEGDFSEKGWADHFAEGNARQYLWFVPHNPLGLAELMGGRKTMIARLDEFFENSKADWESNKLGRLLPLPYYWHSNEPDIHTAYLYAELGEPSKTQKWVRWVLETNYGTGADGLPGNDDAGTMSAWLVFTMLGFYPVPGKENYIIGSPVFEKAKITFPESGSEFIIEAEGTSEENIYITSATLGDRELKKPYINHFDIISGGKLRFKMSAEPTEWGKFEP